MPNTRVTATHAEILKLDPHGINIKGHSKKFVAAVEAALKSFKGVV